MPSPQAFVSGNVISLHNNFVERSSFAHFVVVRDLWETVRDLKSIDSPQEAGRAGVGARPCATACLVPLHLLRCIRRGSGSSLGLAEASQYRSQKWESCRAEKHVSGHGDKKFVGGELSEVYSGRNSLSIWRLALAMPIWAGGVTRLQPLK